MEITTYEYPISRSLDEVDGELFWYVMAIWWRKPHCVNKRRLCGASEFGEKSIDELTKDESEFVRAVGATNIGRRVVECRRLMPKERMDEPGKIVEYLVQDEHYPVAVFLPRQYDWAENRGFINFESPYAIALTQADGKAYLQFKLWSNSSQARGVEWMREAFMPALVRWIEFCQPEKPMPMPLKLLDLEMYQKCYNRLKREYGKHLVEIWSERTDPKKFVYEDIATAAYLLTLWEQDRNSGRCDHRQSFVDLGCGNGLLVYLLNKEKHPGYGIDVRRRKIWDLFGSEVQLIERTFEPSDKHLFPEIDWIIGNHSDELTPWIPVIAAKSSPTCNFFVIPCCAWDFRGKYNRIEVGVSTYRSYLAYVETIGGKCGFDTRNDILKIPSTKRVCILGRRDPNIPINAVRNNIQMMLGGGSVVVSDRSDEEGQKWIQDGFTPRQAKELVRNCTGLPKDSVHGIVVKVVSALLQMDPSNCVSLDDGRKWRIGGSMTMADCARLLTEEELEILKAQCGGIQTLLKNHHQVFNMAKGRVSIRDWTTEHKIFRPNMKYQCWFVINHPDGCPLDVGQCPNSHPSPVS